VLVLKVESGDYVTVGDDVKVFIKKEGNFMYVGIEAPREKLVLRQKLHEKSLAAEKAFSKAIGGKSAPR
jgi:sRNA-binding carbon storage regulator CsrA